MKLLKSLNNEGMVLICRANIVSVVHKWGIIVNA